MERTPVKTSAKDGSDDGGSADDACHCSVWAYTYICSYREEGVQGTM